VFCEVQEKAENQILAHSERLHDSHYAPNEHEDPQHKRQRRYSYEGIDHEYKAEEDAQDAQNSRSPASSAEGQEYRDTTLENGQEADVEDEHRGHQRYVVGFRFPDGTEMEVWRPEEEFHAFFGARPVVGSLGNLSLFGGGNVSLRAVL
jgi:hypothetical protein